MKRPRPVNAISPGANIFFNGFFMLAALSCIIPLLLVVAVSLTPEKELVINGYQLIPEKITTLAYEFVLGDEGKVFRAYMITITVTVVGTVVSTLFCAMIAFPLSRGKLQYGNAISFLVFFTMLFSGGLAPTYFIYSRVFHLKNTLLILMMPHLVNPFNVIIMRTYFKSNIDDAILESARMDGASEWRSFFQIVFPLSLPGIATISLFTTILLWNDWFTSMIYIDTEKLVSVQYLMVKVINNLQYIQANPELTATLGDNIASKIPSESARMAMAVIGIGPIILAYPYFQKYFIKGLTVGSLKG